MVKNACKCLKLCIQIDKILDSFNIKFYRCPFNIIDVITDIRFFFNFFNNNNIVEMFTYLGPMDPLSLSTLVILFIAVVQEMSHFGTLCDVCDVTQHYW